MRILVGILVSAALTAACSSTSSSSTPKVDAGTDAGPPATFTQVYTNVIAKRCVGCHTTPTGIGIVDGKLDMTTQATAYTNLVNAQAAGAACATKGVRITPGKPDSSVMYLKVSLDDAAPCGAKMPLGGPPLAQADADMIESWINGGALNN